MNTFPLYIFLFLALLPTSSLAGLVGGSCTDEVVYGTAQIVKQKKDKVYARFKPHNQYIKGNKVEFSRYYKLPIKQPILGGVGTTYPAKLPLITAGHCQPGGLQLLASETYSSGVFIEIDSNGSITPAAQPTFKELAIIFKELATAWPQLVLDVCGQTHPQGAEEYNFHLGDHYARQIANQLEQQGVPAAHIKTSSYGEHPCPRSNATKDGLQNGAWLSFLLTSQDSKKAKEKN